MPGRKRPSLACGERNIASAIFAHGVEGAWHSVLLVHLEARDRRLPGSRMADAVRREPRPPLVRTVQESETLWIESRLGRIILTGSLLSVDGAMMRSRRLWVNSPGTPKESLWIGEFRWFDAARAPRPRPEIPPNVAWASRPWLNVDHGTRAGPAFARALRPAGRPCHHGHLTGGRYFRPVEAGLHHASRTGIKAWSSIHMRS
jgi:hypothetical protein